MKDLSGDWTGCWLVECRKTDTVCKDEFSTPARTIRAGYERTAHLWKRLENKAYS